MLRLRPMYLRFYPRPAVRPASERARHLQIALAAHSFMAPQLEGIPSQPIEVIDFHNLEWRHLMDSASLRRRSLALGEAVGATHLSVQARLLRRFEAELIRRADLCLFVSEEELAWARRISASAGSMLVRSVLPRSAERAALEIAERRARRAERDTKRLIYVGTLTFPPNAMSLKAFLDHAWQEVRRACPGVELLVAGDAPPALREEIDRVPSVRALGHIGDLAPLAEGAAAAVMPFEGRAGTSLRVLQYALARVPLIGSPAAFRGFADDLGVRADSPDQWARGVRMLLELTAAGQVGRLTEESQKAVLRLQRDPTPWDHLYEKLARLVRGRAAGAGSGRATPDRART